jgi:hypothetical protein
MFLDILEFRIENKKSFGKTVLKMVSQIGEKKVNVSKKVLLEKSLKTKNN